jgi:hypothetical protein
LSCCNRPATPEDSQFYVPCRFITLFALALELPFRIVVKLSLLTYLLTSWSRVILEKLASLQLVKKFPAFYGTQKVNKSYLLYRLEISSVNLHTFIWVRALKRMVSHVLSENCRSHCTALKVLTINLHFLQVLKSLHG